MASPLIVVIAGPTTGGKTVLSVDLACRFNSEIISCDSRQFYREMTIGTAVPSQEQLKQVKHHFIGHLSIHDSYDVSLYETHALAVAKDLFLNNQVVFLTGGSGLYIETFCHGMDVLPGSDRKLRYEIDNEYLSGGIEALRIWLNKLDPAYYAQVDLSNLSRLKRAIEVCLITGKPYSELRTGKKASRPFRILKIAVYPGREELLRRIEVRTDNMIASGLIEEAKTLYSFRHLNPLNTVGYKELFNYFDGTLSLPEAIEKIKSNTRRYAKRQLTWFKKYTGYHWVHPSDIEQVIRLINQETKATLATDQTI